MRRIGIYLTYDKQGIIDRYIGYMLRELKTCVDYLIVVCNEKEVIAGIENLIGYADEILYRDNIGFDAGGFKDVLCNLAGWKKILSFDELVLINDSMFGPFRPIKDIFTEMSVRSVDFWGLTKNSESENKEAGHIPEHIQSFFLVIRDNMLHSPEFRDYWDRMPYYDTFENVILHYELNFTQFFSGLGYRYDTFADTDENDSCDTRNNYSQYPMLSFELIKKRNFPFLKRQQLVYDTMHQQTQENLRLAIDYIDRETAYDVNLIWDHIIRTMNVGDLQRSLHLSYTIFPSDQKAIDETIVVVVLISHKKSFPYVLEYIKELQTEYLIRIAAEQDEYLDDYKEHGFDCIKIDKTDISGFLRAYSHFDLVAVLHDADLTSDIKPSYVGKSYFYNIWENLAKDREHVRGILDIFRQEPRLGFVTSPQPNFEEYFGEYGKGWDGNFEKAAALARAWDLNCRMDEIRPPFRVTENFWIRGTILRKLGNVTDMDSSLLAYLWSYLAQDCGYYSGIVESENYASMNGVNLQHYLQQIAFLVRHQYGDFNSFPEMKEQITLGALKNFCSKYQRILVYGIGRMTERYKNRMPHIEGYIVSDGQMKPEKFGGIPVKYLSEITEREDCGIVVCLCEKNQMQVIPLLKERGFRNYFCI